ncbi:ABC transporter substrate-binding protein [Acidimicrobiia bacterium EGI L10123]|uniref:ABC transporter substrate-binding protein n=1 Tax=Salinilacustrithrix flava TaxID=2957203 RepID=UPI003D7C18FC|nr:ABC transporter substrate-binding protein [Acidimicrobiia bacterium EGI L10123]
MRASRLWRIFAMLLALSLVAAACGDDDDDTDAATDDTTEDTADDGGDDGGEDDGDSGAMEGEIEVAEGTVINTDDCPSDWDPEAGLTDDEITLFMSLPESGPVAALGGLDDGMRAWFDQMEPIDGRTINLVSSDDAYDPARTLSNVEDSLETEEPFAMTYMVGTANVLAVRDLVSDECMPMLFNSTGFPAWGDPAEYPWTIGGLLGYNTEADLWCTYVNQEIGEDATVAALFMDNDFGLAYEETVNECDIDLVESVRHDPAAPDVTSEITTLASSDADVVLLGTTGAPCPQAMAAIAQSSWQPQVILSNTCQGIATYFAPIDPAGDGVLVAATAKEAGELEDEDVMAAREALEAAGLNPDEGSFYTGVIFAHTVENTLRAAAEMEGGLNRVNLMRAVWNADFSNPLGLDGGTYQTNGTSDAYLVEAAQFVQYVPPAEGEELGRYEPVGDLINIEGQTGSVGG